ncbi:uncharacterized protein EV422DRAFT_74189 [Fimicolochytrium jonesii]|uniref:uncharacterized protein n=1 Tax=Fimicolochytrium jonesii TaxID=1396493 RepID=UPI0022FE0A56|nr:uncharacterized protein EV422DRAFT_74189 [Fimicolochytrium jonesii]KAI8820520.1 hypothetical protein EV422DRAFT_74189 [Fimicolochytrium jonesii]
MLSILRPAEQDSPNSVARRTCSKALGKFKIAGSLALLSVWARTASAVGLSNPENVPPLHSRADEAKPAASFSAGVASLLQFRKSDVMLAQTFDGKISRSENLGATWNEAVMEGKGPVLGMGLHETQDRWAFLFTDKEIYLSQDEAKSVKQINTPEPYNGLGMPFIDFHPEKAEWYTFLGGARQCGQDLRKPCFTTAYVTKDDGKTWGSGGQPRPIETWANKCIFARDVGYNDASIPEDAVYCLSYKNKHGTVGQDILSHFGPGENALQLVEITNYEKSEVPTRRVLIERGVREFFVVAGTLVVAVEDNHELKLMVSKNGKEFKAARYPPDMAIQGGEFTLLQSDKSVFLDVVQGRVNTQGTLLKSDQGGETFQPILHDTHRTKGRVDYERMQGINGTILANVVTDRNPFSQSVASRMSFDDGATWSALAAPAKDSDCKADQGCNLHLYCQGNMQTPIHRVASAIHSDPNAPGLMIAVGNVGKRLDEYRDGNVYLTTDAGRTWAEIHKDAHRWAVGNHGGTIVLVNDEGPTNKLEYTTDYGQTWKTKIFDQTIRLQLLTTTPTLDSVRFAVFGSPTNSFDKKTLVYSFELADTVGKDCSDGDFEGWASSASKCTLGQDLQFRRKKGICKITKGSEVFRVAKTCPCEDADYECDFGFELLKDGKCDLNGHPDPNQPLTRPSNGEYKTSSGYRKILASKCEPELKGKTDPVNKKWDGKTGSGVSISVLKTTGTYRQYFYFDRTHVMIQLVSGGKSSHWLSEDGGKVWKPLLDGKKITAVAQDPFHTERAFFRSEAPAQELYVFDISDGSQVKEIKAPFNVEEIDSYLPLRTHPTEKGWLLWLNKEAEKGQAKRQAWYTKNFGSHWDKIEGLHDVYKCEWAYTKDSGMQDKSAVLCVDRVAQPAGHSVLMKISDKKIVSTAMDAVSDFAVVEKYILAVKQDPIRKEVLIYVSEDGNNWARAQFPGDTVLKRGYTLLDSSSGSLFLAVFEDDDASSRKEYASLFVGNRNATVYEKRKSMLHMNSKGYTDFEKMAGVEGIALMNIVNLGIHSGGGENALQTQLTLDDGAHWSFLQPPAESKDHQAYCKDSKSLDDCALHLSSYTSRQDVRDQFSAKTAPGLIIGNGNVGKSLNTAKSLHNTYLSSDAGHTWTEIAMGPHKWEFGDQGGLILLVGQMKPISRVQLSRDYGRTFEEQDITIKAGGKMAVHYMFSEPSGTSTVFVLVGELATGESAVVTLDFTDQMNSLNACKTDPGAGDSDVEAWAPQRLSQPNAPAPTDQCFFGEKTIRYRRKQNAVCRMGDTPIAPAKKQCECTEADFECEYNHERVDGKCVLSASAGGLVPQECKDGRLWSTAYRLKTESKCHGGLELHKGTLGASCGNRSLGFGSWFLVILTSVGGAGFITWGFVNYRERLFGRIRLPADDNTETSTFGRSRGSGLNGALLTVVSVGVGIAEIIAEKTGHAWEWVRVRWLGRRDHGYQPVGGDHGGSDSFASGPFAGGFPGGRGAHEYGGDDDALLDFEDY